MQKGIVLKLIAACMLLLFVGCRQVGSSELPAGWPIPELTLPPGAHVPQLYKEGSVNFVASPTVARVVFEYSGEWPDVVEHFESCLGPLGYYEYWVTSPRLSDLQAFWRTYYSPDHLTQVEITNRDGLAENGPTPEWGKGEYKIVISITTTPDPELDNVGTTSSTGREYHLEPLK